MGANAVMLVRALGRIAQAGAGAFAASQSTQPAPSGGGAKRRKRRRKSDEECSPCAAYAMVDDAKKRVREGRL